MSVVQILTSINEHIRPDVEAVGCEGRREESCLRKPVPLPGSAPSPAASHWGPSGLPSSWRITPYSTALPSPEDWSCPPVAGPCHCTLGTPGRIWLAVTSCWTSSARLRTWGTQSVPTATPLPPVACRYQPSTPVPACSYLCSVTGDPLSHLITPGVQRTCYSPSPPTHTSPSPTPRE